ncbi:MAG TPA: CoA transferase, partial [Spongiibacteraceae bacterium]|nr:CoA transferase [Spongiibacteraceae bacterium]
AHLLNTSYAVAQPDGTGFARPKVDGMNFGFNALTRLYETKKGWLCLVAATEAHWDALCLALGIEGLNADPRFNSFAARAQNDAVLAELMTAAFSSNSAAHWFAVLDGAGVPCEISDGEFSQKMHDDSELQQLGWVASYPHPVVGKLDQIGLLFNFSETPGVVQGPPLMVGQHSREIMQSLGYTDADISQACEDGYVAAWGAGELQKEFKSPWQVDKIEKK